MGPDRNRRNALHSTGPKSSKGRAKSARNARKHGLSELADADRLLTWFRRIMGDPEASLDSLADARTRAALALAEAEERLERVVQEEARRLRELEEELGQANLFGVTDNFGQGAVRPAAASKLTVQEEPPPAWRLLDRYRREAESGRHEALKKWIAVDALTGEQPQFPKRSQIQLEVAASDLKELPDLT